MLTAAQINVGGEFLTDIAITQWLTLIRALPIYRKSPGLYSGLEAKLQSLKQGVIVPADVVKAKALNAALSEIEKLLAKAGGMQAVALSKSVEWSLSENVVVLVMDGLNALYDVPAARPSSAVRKMKSSICVTHNISSNTCGCIGARLIF